MKLLAFELATEGCSVALWLDGEVHERFEVAPRRHAELALPWAESLLAEAGIARAQLDAIAIGRGPGAFTGVRLAIALAQGIALALDRPIVPISTLAALAFGLPLPLAGRDDAAGAPLARAPSSARTADARRGAERGWGEGAPDRRVLAAIDARMNEIYSAGFELRDGDARPLSAESVGPPDDAQLPDDSRWHGRGTGFAACDNALQHRLAGQLIDVDATALPHAADVARLAAHAAARGELVAPERVEPAYLRNQVALTLAEQQARREQR